MDTKLTPAQARQLNLLRTAGPVRDTYHGRSVKGLTTPVLQKLLALGLVVLSYEIATYTYQVPNYRGRYEAHALIWAAA